MALLLCCLKGMMIQRYRPICLLNVPFMTFTVVKAKPLFILDGVLLLREIIHEIRVKKRSVVNFKLDFKKGQN